MRFALSYNAKTKNAYHKYSRMKKIGIVTVTNHNFGSILQTFALQIVVRKMGYDTEIIKYHEPKSKKIFRLRNKEYAVSRLKMLFKYFIMTLRFRKGRNKLKLRFTTFKKFVDKELFFSKACTNKKELTNISKSYGTILLGSDQVWHPMNLYMDFFTLSFVPAEVNKVAYAPSFGVSSLPKSHRKSYKKFISRFNYLSCREESGVKLIKRLTGKNAQWVCDPTILLSSTDWLPYLSDKVKFESKYVFCYFIGDNPSQRLIVKQFASERGLKVIGLLHIDEYIPNDESYTDYAPYDIGPSEFLYLIKNAKYVMTDSFHATVFSLLFHNNFYTFNRFENRRGKPTTSRIDSLLTIVNLSDRKVPNQPSMDYFNQVQKINFDDIDSKLAAFRQSSIEYLKNALKV